jgi:hypothetical protein
MYALEKLLHATTWYAFSMSPSKIAMSVVSLLSDAKSVIETDYGKFDGTHGEFLCRLELAILRRYFSPLYHSEINELYKKQYNAIGYTRHGVRYNTGFSRLSGSPETSAFNSIDNAFVAYVALRTGPYSRDGQEKLAYSKLGLYGGDDGLSVGIDPKHYTRVAANFGLNLTSCVTYRGTRVKFLGRYFADPWNGDPGSYCDVRRQVAKLHLSTASPEITNEEIVYRKALGYILTDPETPFLAVWAAKIISLYGDNLARPVAGDLRWFEKYSSVDQFPQVTDGSLMRRDVASDLDSNEEMVIAAENMLFAAKTFKETFPRQTWFGKPSVPKIMAKLGHEIVIPPPKPPKVNVPSHAPRDESKRKPNRRPRYRPASSTVSASL